MELWPLLLELWGAHVFRSQHRCLPCSPRWSRSLLAEPAEISASACPLVEECGRTGAQRQWSDPLRAV